MLGIKRYSAFENFESREDAEKFAKEHDLKVSDELNIFFYTVGIFGLGYIVLRLSGSLL